MESYKDVVFVEENVRRQIVPGRRRCVNALASDQNQLTTVQKHHFLRHLDDPRVMVDVDREQGFSSPQVHVDFHRIDQRNHLKNDEVVQPAQQIYERVGPQNVNVHFIFDQC